jgi:Putative adhesin
MIRASYIPRMRQRIAGRIGASAGILAAGIGSAFLAIAFLIPSPAVADGAKKAKTEGQSHAGPRVSADLTGSAPVRDGQRLHLVTDLGNIVIKTQNSGKFDYKVHLEADATQKDAKQLLKNFIITTNPTAEGVYFRGQSLGRHASGRLWVTVEVNVPRNFNLDISTGGGNIEAEDIIGTATLGTSGGNIVMANVGGPAHLSTDGGHITVKNVAGALAASTGGGHITTGTIAGNAILHTDGGHIRVASVEGVAHVSTGGGNVSVEHSGSQLVAETIGGQIEVGESAGLVQAKTGGGGIRVVRVSGPTNLETSGGSIYLTEVDSAVKASTGAGAITAWFVAPGKMPGQCELQSGEGDIVVYIPRQLPVTIDAQVQSGNEHHVIFDPAFPVKISREAAANGDEWVRTEGALNGGGEVIRLRTVAGNIHVMVSDANKQVQLYKQQMEQLQQKLQLQLRMLQQQSQQTFENSP